MNGLDILIAFLEGAIEQQQAIVDKIDNRFRTNDFEEGKLQALGEVLEEATFIKINMMKENSK